MIGASGEATTRAETATATDHASATVIIIIDDIGAGRATSTRHRPVRKAPAGHVVKYFYEFFCVHNTIIIMQNYSGHFTVAANDLGTLMFIVLLLLLLLSTIQLLVAINH